jgi:threonine/homoserine/homoserine lactone efflux protein
MTTGVGIATGDAVYGAVGALGLASIAAFLAAHAQPIHIIAGVILFALGVQTLLKRRDAYVAATIFLSPPPSFDLR